MAAALRKPAPDRHPLLQQNLLDKVIAYVAPKAAQMRIMQRAQIAALGGYSGARVDRAALARWNPGAGSPRSDIIEDLPMLRSRSRDQMRNAPIAVGALHTACSNVVGTGLSLSPSLDAAFLRLSPEQAAEWQRDTRRRYNTWAASKDCALDRTLNFYELQELAFRATLESGDAFCLTPRVARAGGAARLALQLLEADLVCNPLGMRDSATLTDGIEFDATTGEPLRCHVASKHPGDPRNTGNSWTPVAFRGSSTGRRNVLHLFKPVRPGQRRGVPWVAPILEPLKQINRYTDAELQAAVTSGMFSVFVKMDPDAFTTMFNEDAQGVVMDAASKWSGEMESGKAINLLPGESIESANPGRPNAQFDPFVQSILRQIGVALELPYEVLVMHYQSSYSAARAALLQAWKFFRSRREWLATNFCQPVYELWLADEVAEGRIPAPGFFASDLVRAAWCAALWTGDGPGSIDPVKEVTAAKERVALGISTKQAESILHDGVDWDVKHAQRVKEVDAEKRDGLYQPPAGAPAPMPGQQGGQGDDPPDDDDDGGDDQEENPMRRAAPGAQVHVHLPQPTAIKTTPVLGANGEILYTIQEPVLSMPPAPAPTGAQP